jgi:hypothetical protein
MKELTRPKVLETLTNAINEQSARAGVDPEQVLLNMVATFVGLQHEAEQQEKAS